jgi:hypothetical protein
MTATMGFSPNISKNSLPNYIERSGTLLILPYEHCAHLNKHYIKLLISKHYSECAYFNYCYYTKMSTSDLAWKKLIKAQNSLDKQEEATLAKLLQLQK